MKKIYLPSWVQLTSMLALVMGCCLAHNVEQMHLRGLIPPRALLDNNATETCTVPCCQDLIQCDSTSTSENPFAVLPVAIQFVMMALLVICSALFAGLTLGVMGLDQTGLQIVMESDDPKNAEYARRIYPIRQKGNQLLSTLLVGNTAANALFSILIADYAGGLVGFLVSTIVILFFGEILPQAFCSRYALQVGSASVPMVKALMCLLYPFAMPMALALDWLLGRELPTIYSNAEMLKLLQIHVAENAMDPDTATTMTGALRYKDIMVQQVMTPLENTFMLRADEKLNFETIAKIFKTGYSRIPVYEVNKNNVIGLLFVKDLIFIDPEDETRVSDFVDIFGRGVHVVWPDDKLGDVLRELKQGRSHMALVRGVNNEDETQDPFYEIMGIVTLEDIIEEILGHEIVDETDAFLDGTHSVKLDRADAIKFARLRLLDSKIVDERLSSDETKAITAHLWKNHSDVVSLLTEKQLHRLIAETSITILPTAPHELGEDLPSELLYKKGVPSDTCTLILAGKVSVLVGVDQFRSDVSSWCLLAAKALEDVNYKPDFSAYVSDGPCRCLRISRHRFTSAVDASATERQSGSHHSGSIISQNTSVENSNTNESLLTNGSTPSTISDTIETSRKAKLITALRAFDKVKKTSEPPDKESNQIDMKNYKTSNVSFAEPGSSAAFAASDRPLTKVPSIKKSDLSSIKTSYPKQSRFEYISSPSIKDCKDDTTEEDK